VTGGDLRDAAKKRHLATFAFRAASVASLTGKTGMAQPPPMNSLHRFADSVYSIMRLIVGLMFACHGGQLVVGLFGGIPGSGTPMSQIGGWIQLIGGLLIAFGLLTRVAAFICSGTMAVAYFTIHVAHAATPAAKFFPIATAGPHFSNRGELAVLYCWVFLFMFSYGPGRWSIDSILKSKPQKAASNV
jgi:putative oxidoreductase